MHNFNIVRKSMELAGKTLTVETGRMAKQANGSVFITYGETCFLVTATMAKEVKEGQDFFPLTVDFIEKMYSAGKIPGGFFKREAKPSTDATLTCRVIDRAIRPMFPEGFLNAVHVVITVLSYDGQSDPGALGLIGASIALGISDIPFFDPIGSVMVGILDDEIVINPELPKLADSKLELAVAGTKESIVMIEAGASEISEETMMDAIYQGHEVIKEICKFQTEYIEEAGKAKIEFEPHILDESYITKVSNEYSEKVLEAVLVQGKFNRADAVSQVKKDMLEALLEELGEEAFEENKGKYTEAYETVVKKVIRKMVLEENKRIDGRGPDDIRPISIDLDILPRVHGSALFTRGETQSLGSVTLGTGSDEQIIDGLSEEYRKRYFLHYNFPPFSVGEAGFMRAPGRRELGHGALAERALYPVIPTKEEFPYTLRIVSDILESNGSSSMATVCSGTLSMLAAGVPIKKPVAGIANGLIHEDGKFVVLTDILGTEDPLGDMDFKVTGTDEGITAMQMDIKIKGITKDIMGSALEKAKNARLYILGKIKEAITDPRNELSPYAPRIESLTVHQSKISEIIGSGGKTIKSIIEATKVQIDISDDGEVTIASPDGKSIEAAKEMITNIISDPVRNEVYKGVITRVEPYGVFVKFMGSKMGLVHVSQMASKRIRHPEDICKIGDNIKVRFTGMKDGKFQLAMKGIEGNPEPAESAKPHTHNKRHHSQKDHSKN